MTLLNERKGDVFFLFLLLSFLSATGVNVVCYCPNAITWFLKAWLTKWHGSLGRGCCAGVWASLNRVLQKGQWRHSPHRYNTFFFIILETNFRFALLYCKCAASNPGKNLIAYVIFTPLLLRKMISHFFGAGGGCFIFFFSQAKCENALKTSRLSPHSWYRCLPPFIKIVSVKEGQGEV